MVKENPYELDDDPARVDVDAVSLFMATQAYWARWRTSDDVRRQVEGAWRVVGCYDSAGRMVGFARAISDGVALAYLADVFVLSGHRGQGLGKAIVHEMIDNGPGAGFRWMLHTADAHDMYRAFGFGEPDATSMERPSRRVRDEAATRSS